MRRPLDVPQNGKSASFRSCVRAGEAKLRVCVREIMLLYAGLLILEFLFSPSPPSPSLIEHCFLHGFYQFSQFFVDICMGFMYLCLWSIVFCMGFINFLNVLLIYAWVLSIFLIH